MLLLMVMSEAVEDLLVAAAADLLAEAEEEDVHVLVAVAAEVMLHEDEVAQAGVDNLCLYFFVDMKLISPVITTGEICL